MKFVIRDDDLNYFSNPTDIERWYKDIFTQKIPISFAAIPFVKPISDVYTNNAPKENKEFPISANAELVSYVKNNPLIEIIQHGCTHETKNGIFEYQWNKDLFKDTARGKEELEHAFKRSITVFAPPHDWIGSRGVLAIEASHLNIIRGRGTGLKNLILRWQYLIIFLAVLFFKFSNIFKKNIPAYPYVLDFGLHKEICSYRLEDEDVFDGLEYVNQKKGIFVVVTHLHFYTDEKKIRLLELIKIAKEYDSEFVFSSSVFAGTRKPYL